MRRKIWIFCGLLMVKCYMVCAMEASIQKKVESTEPITTLSPPEGNTTFIDGTTWCVALPGVTEADLQNALDWACGLGSADCSTVQTGGPCFEPNTLLSHASYAFNSYYQQNGNSDIACNFGGTATITKRNPSYGSCFYATSEPSSASFLLCQRPFAWEILVILLLLYMRR